MTGALEPEPGKTPKMDVTLCDSMGWFKGQGIGKAARKRGGGHRMSARWNPGDRGLRRNFGRPESDVNGAYSVADTVPASSRLVIDVISSLF